MSVNSREQSLSPNARRWALPRWMLFIGIAIVFSASLLMRYLGQRRPALPDSAHGDVFALKLSGVLVYVSVWDLLAVVALIVTGISVAFLACRRKR